MATSEGRQRVLRTIQPLQVSRLFLEGRRGDSYVAPNQLREIREFFVANGIRCSGGIATVPGANFGMCQTGGLDWLNWESPRTRADVTQFFSENAPVWDEIIVDDFFCTGDKSPEAERAKGSRDWGDYRRDLLVSLIEPLMTQPTRASNRRTKLIIKFPQWYDRFHMFGYDPLRMSAQFEQVWVGTEVRNPKTPRWGYTQPTEGYMNFRWLASVAGKKVRGAWFDHIECSAQNFVDQAFQSVLAGAQELTLFCLSDLMAAHAGDALLAERISELRGLAARLRGKPHRGIAFYKPPGSAAGDNTYLADHLGMIGLPILPVANYPSDAAVAFLPLQAASDAELLVKMRQHLKRGATLVLTPALVRALGHQASALVGVEVGPESSPAAASEFPIAGKHLKLEEAVELDASAQSGKCETLVAATVDGRVVPFLTSTPAGRGRVMVLNVRTFSEQDFRAIGEWLLTPKDLGLTRIPQELADALRRPLLAPLRVDFRGPAGIELVLFQGGACVYSFRDEAVQIQFAGKQHKLPAHGWLWLK